MKTLSKTIKVGLLILLSAVIISCDNDDYYEIDTTPPSPPTNVRVLPGDGEIEITWDHNSESDLAGYNVYYSETYWGKYTNLGNTPNNIYYDVEAGNGDLYYYGIAAYDYDGNESELSYDEVYGIARPQGLNQVIFDAQRFPNNSGYDFSEFTVVAFDELSDDYSSDMFFDIFEGTYYINVFADSEIQDMGLTNDIYDILYAPVGGWVPLLEGDNVKYTEVFIGHTYVISTWDNHYAKIRVKEITTERMVFDWAYQLVEGERQMKSNPTSGKRISLPNEIIRKK
jgi:hypothetical protein